MGRGVVALLIAATATGVIAAAIVVTTVTRIRSPLERLAAVVGPHRVTRARLTGGFAYAPCDSSAPNDSLVTGLRCDRTNPEQWVESGRLATMAAELRKPATSARSSTLSSHATASWQIILGTPQAAVAQLRAAAQAAPTDASIQSDLAAAYLARAEREQDPRWILDAFTAADSALALDSLGAEARFNRAVVLEQLGLRSDAIAAWSAYLQVDAGSAWAGEARAHRERLANQGVPWSKARDMLGAAVDHGRDSLVRALVSRYPYRVRSEIRKTMTAWAHAYEGDSVSRADTLLATARTLAGAVAGATQDSLWSDALAPLVVPNANRDRVSTVARGLLAYERGEGLLGRSHLDSAERWLAESQRLLRTADNAAQYLASYSLATTSFSRETARDHERALVQLRALRAAAPNAYRIVRGLAARTEGVILGVQANYVAAINAYSTTIAESRGTGDPGLQLRPHANLATNYAALGDDRAAWTHLYDGLRQWSRYPEASSDIQRVLLRSAELSGVRAPALALLFQRQATRLARQASATAADSQLTIAALIREAELLARQRRIAAARETVRSAREYVARIESDSTRALSAADVDLVEGQALVMVHPDSAIPVLRSVVDRYRATKYFSQMARAELLLANAYATTGAMEPAQRELEAALAEVERRRANIAEPEDRARFLDQARPVIDTLVRLLADRGDTLGALRFLEQMRGRVLLERVRQDAGETEPVESLDAIQRALPVATTLVSYAVLPREVFAWVITRNGVRMHRMPLASNVERLAGLLSELLASRSATAEAQAASAELYRALVAPLVRDIPVDTRLVIVPDKWLQFVPFAALYDSAASQFFVQRFELNVAPSVRLYVEAARRYEALHGRQAPTVLAVGNPAFDTRVFSLPRLPNAEREAVRVASLYRGSQKLVGPAATKDAFLRAAATANVIHFAGHGVVRPDAPLLSYLVLAADSGASSGALTAKDLFGRSLPSTWLAVLSGCQTAGGGLSDTEGVSSLARAFFAAGVPAVVASLWSVDDEATAEFFSDYHLVLSKSRDPSAALRSTQLAWARKHGWSGAPTWAAFTLFGATTPNAPEGR